MDRFTRLFAALEQIFGKGFVSRLMGKQSNVITLPSKDAKKFLNTELNIAEASEAAVKKGIEDLEKLVSDTNKLSLINDQELLVITNNTERLAQRVNPKAGPDAEVINLGTKEKVSPEGIMQLKETMGQRNAPGTLMGDLEGGINKLKASSEDLSKMKGQTLDELMGDFSQGQKTMLKLEDEGLVRAAAREIIGRDIKSGKIKLPKELEQDIVQGGGEPVDIWRQFYGEDALEQLDSMVPEFRNMYSPKEAADAAVKKFNFNPQLDRPPGSTNVDDAIKSEKDLGIKTPKDDIEDPEGFAAGGRVGMAKGGITALKTLINFLTKNRKNYFLAKNKGMGPTTGSKSLQALNPKSLGYKQNFLTKEMDQQYLDNRIDYFKNLQNVIKNDRELLINMKALPKEHQDKFYKMINEGGNKGRLDVYNKIDIDDAIMDIEQIIKNAEFKNLSEEAVKRKMNAEGGSQGLDYLMGIERRGYANGSTSRESIINNILKEIEPGFENENSIARMYADDYKTGLDLDYLKTLTPDEVKLALDDTYLQGKNFQNPDFSRGRIGGGSPFFKYDPQYMEQFNISKAGSPLQLSNPYTGYNLKNELGELESILGKEGIKPYMTKADDALIDFYKTKMSGDSDLQKRLFGDSIMANEQTTPETPTEDFSDYLDTPTEEQIVSPDDAMNQYNIETPETDFFSGPAYDKYNKERTDAYANSPSKFDYDIRANEAAGQFIQDKITGSLGDNKLGRFAGDAAALASVPLAIFGSPFHEAAQVVSEDRMEPGSGIKGFAKAFMNEQPISTAINRGAGVLQSTALGKGIYNLGGDLYNLKEKLQQLPYMQQYQQDYQKRISQVDPNALHTQYLQKLQNPNATNMDQFKSQLQSNLTPTPMNTGGRVGYAGGGRTKQADGTRPQGLNYLMGY